MFEQDPAMQGFVARFVRSPEAGRPGSSGDAFAPELEVPAPQLPKQAGGRLRAPAPAAPAPDSGGVPPGLRALHDPRVLCRSRKKLTNHFCISDPRGAAQEHVAVKQFVDRVASPPSY